MSRLLLFCADEDDMFGWLNRHPNRTPDCVVHRGKFIRLDGQPAFDRMATTAAAYRGLSADLIWPLGLSLLLDHPTVRACLTRVKGPDGLTVGQRLGAQIAKAASTLDGLDPVTRKSLAHRTATDPLRGAS